MNEAFSVPLAICYYFVGVGFEKTLITPVASGVLSCRAVITQRGAHLRQPCLLLGAQGPGPVSGGES